MRRPGAHKTADVSGKPSKLRTVHNIKKVSKGLNAHSQGEQVTSKLLLVCARCQSSCCLCAVAVGIGNDGTPPLPVLNN